MRPLGVATLCDKKLKDCFFPQKTSGKLAIFAIKPDGITNTMLIAKNLSNPVHVSTDSTMRDAKEVLLRNGRKALAYAEGANSNYRDGKLPSGRTIADYHWYMRESMFQKLKGARASSNDNGDNDAFGTSHNEKEDCDESNVAETKMPEDYFSLA